MEGHEVTYSVLPVALVFLPLGASLVAWRLGRFSETLRDWFAVLVTAATFLGAAALIPQVAEHHRVGSDLPVVLGHITFEVDPFGMFFGIFTSFVWMVSTLYATAYMTHEHKRDRYHAFNLAVLGANMGVVLAGDLVSLYLFFEALGLAAYWLVVHTETDEAKKASLKYLWMTVAGGFALIAGIFVFFGLGSEGAIGPIDVEGASELLRWAAAILMILGFGVKAGMLPVHIWLPDAHPVAPSPASALLSGIMIKAGAYGIFRVVTALFRPAFAEHIEEELWQFTTNLGYVVIWLGIVTMFVGVVLALLQENAKRMLAYHSISQMGFILAGIGAAGYLAGHGAMGYAGGLYHVVNHALFKACLFLGVGAVYFRTHELDMYKLGGLWRKMPLTFVFTLIAALGITGFPLFNGFVSKCLIHHALVEAHEMHHLAALKVAEIIYIVTCGGTACSFMKLIIFVFLGKPKREYPDVKEAPARMLVAMAALAVPITVLGLVPGLVLDHVIAPGLHLYGLHTEVLEHFVLFTGENLLSVAYAFGIGTIVFVVGVRYGLFHIHAPAWLGVDYWYVRAADGTVAACGSLYRGYEAYTNRMSLLLARTTREVSKVAVRVRRHWRRLVVTLRTGAPGLRNQQFLDTAYVILEDERHGTVRNAVDEAVERFREREDLPEESRQAYIDSVRDVADYMATRLFDERIGVVGEMLRRGRVDPVRVALEEAMQQVASYRESVAAVSLRLAEPRLRGENVLREMAGAMNALMGEERFDLKMEEGLPQWSAGVLAGRTQHRLEEAVPGHELVSAYRAGGLTRLEHAGRWLAGTARALVEAVVQDRVPWMIEERFDRRGIEAARLAIQRYVREIGLNVAIAIGVLLIFALLIIVPSM